MATNTFNTRIQSKYDTYSNWTTNNPVLLEGEIAITVVPASAGAVQQEPAILIKVGDGESTYNELSFVSALAANVYDWALGETKPEYTADEIEGLADYISGHIEDTDTQYQLVASGTNGIQLQSRPKTGGSWTNVGSPITITYTLVEGTTNGTVSFNGTEVAVHGLGSAAYTNADAYDAAGAATAVQTAITGSAGDGADALTLHGIKAYADQEATAAVTEATSQAQELVNALDVAAVTAGTGEVISAVSQTDGKISVTKRVLASSDIPDIEQSQVTGLTTALAGKQDTVVFNTTYNSQTNKAATMADVNNAVAGLSGAMHYVGESTTDPSTGTATVEGHEDWVSGDVVTYQSKEYVYDGENWRELGDESSYAIKGAIVNADIAENAAIDQDKIAGLPEALAGKATPADITNAINALDVGAVTVTTGNKITSIEEVDGKIAVTTGAIVADDIPELPQSKINGLTTALNSKLDQTQVDARVNAAIGNLDKEDTAVANQVVTAVSEADGIITVTRRALTVDDIPNLAASKITGLEDIATTGNVNDLVQTEGDILIFNCGSSSVNI